MAGRRKPGRKPAARAHGQRPGGVPPPAGGGRTAVRDIESPGTDVSAPAGHDVSEADATPIEALLPAAAEVGDADSEAMGREDLEAGGRDAPAGRHERLWATGLPNVWWLARRELGSLFVSPIFYVSAALLAIVAGLFGYIQPLAAGQAFSLGTNVFPVVRFLLVIFAPLFTMRLLAEERRTGTLEVLLTAPVRDWEVVAGKWLGALVAFAASIAFTLVYVILVSVAEPLRTEAHWFGRVFEIPAVDYGSIWAGYAGLLLYGAAATAIGLLASSVTSNQIIAAVIAVFALLLLFQGLGFLTDLPMPQTLRDGLNYLAVSGHALAFDSGRLPLADAVYFLSLVVVPLFLATRVLESRRWR
ncbi:MAG: ABC transporter permease [Candidatus Dormibacteraeota bacterium]|nr:ABC transporter permease [Candidatus Dormibacteraeota bacterium]